MTDNVEQETTPVTDAERIQLMRNGILQTGWDFQQKYRNFLKQLPIEPAHMAVLLQKIDDSWYMARVIVEDLQISLAAT
jgi:hypothetical protein